MQVMQIPDSEKILVFGGHTDQGGPNKEIEIIDLGIECLKAKYGNNFLSLQSEGGKTYFPPLINEAGRIQLIFGYCDEAPLVEEIDLSMLFNNNSMKPEPGI